MPVRVDLLCVGKKTALITTCFRKVDDACVFAGRRDEECGQRRGDGCGCRDLEPAPACPARPSRPELAAKRERHKHAKNAQNRFEPAGPYNRRLLRSCRKNAARHLDRCLSLERPRPCERPRTTELAILKDDVVRTFRQSERSCC